LYVKKGVDFLLKEKVTPYVTEHYIQVEGKYQGTIDLLAWIDGEQWILDWKTYGIAQEILQTKSSSWKYKKPYDKLKKATLQLSLYAKAL
jgi:ATP-dependent exoDNAse (exonuclease V) beta subunit